MHVTLGPDVEKRIQELVERGDYPSADVLVREAVGSFLDVESEADLDTIRQRIADSELEIDRGEFVEYDAATIRDLARDVDARGQEKLLELRGKNPRG